MSKRSSPFDENDNSNKRRKQAVVVHTVYNSNDDESVAHSLLTEGVVVIDMKQQLLSNGLDETAFRAMVRDLPEYNVPSGDNNYTFITQMNDGKSVSVNHYATGFCALGGSGQQHAPFARKMRQVFHARVRGIFQRMAAKQYGSDKPAWFNVMFDRCRVVPKGTKSVPSGGEKQIHRDLHPCRDGASIFGGFINFTSDETYQFACIPKTQIARCKDYVGESFFRTTDEKDDDMLVQFAVPPYSCVVFYQSLAHTVRPLAPKSDCLRYYIGLRLSDNEEWDWTNTYNECMNRQSLAPLPSGQYPWMYPSGVRRYHAERFSAWCRHSVRPHLLNKDGILADRMLDCSTDGVFPPYEEGDKKVMLPHML
jgi:hypothetical protein